MLIVIGSGIAGLYTALQARGHGDAMVITKGGIEDSNTRYAQGGIAAAMGADDSPALHFADTLAAGAGLVDETAAQILTDQAGDRIADLVRFGVPFDTLDGSIALGHEAAHSARRILHAGGDATGAHIEMTLATLARQERVTVLEHTLATGLTVRDGRVVAVSTLDSQSGAVAEYAADAVVLATGGAGQLYQYTTNPSVATGDGIALAYQAGAEVMDMEFIQFHPTALRLPGVPVFLISEAVRGEGALLVAADEHRFMPKVDPRAELAPRDIVARAIDREMRRTGSDHVWLDVTHLPAARITARFPQIYRFCLEQGLDITRERIPVSPAAHYTMGGVRTDGWGRTTIAGLFAAGEVACTGVHGANRLASNSLLETVVFAKRVVETITTGEAGALGRSDDVRVLPRTVGAGEPLPAREPLQRAMWQSAGIVRDATGLTALQARLARWRVPHPDGRDAHETHSLLTVACLVVDAALKRQESRGAHYRSDFPEPAAAWLRHQVYRHDDDERRAT